MSWTRYKPTMMPSPKSGGETTCSSQHPGIPLSRLEVRGQGQGSFNLVGVKMRVNFWFLLNNLILLWPIDV